MPRNRRNRERDNEEEDVTPRRDLIRPAKKEKNAPMIEYLEYFKYVKKLPKSEVSAQRKWEAVELNAHQNHRSDVVLPGRARAFDLRSSLSCRPCGVLSTVQSVHPTPPFPPQSQSCSTAVLPPSHPRGDHWREKRRLAH
ncbi:unnamed protein product [Cyprideis torosa]|uniref:Uncharacterized protein n=1 Tax=Cyprideis torosa TaxID=163714 RepID=A0A7R8WM27_9CRUS|nr:unnamed protein product [Cyprideis torosa]CAG0904921.1 unnamed protein product [Cyprideis torosa]